MAFALGVSPAALSKGNRAPARPCGGPIAAPPPVRPRCAQTRQRLQRRAGRAAPVPRAGPDGRDGSGSGSGSSNVPVPVTPGSFLSLESLIQSALSLRPIPGGRGDWEEVEGSWVLFPPGGAAPEAVVHFLGGAFVGAAPQLAYRGLLEALAGRGVAVVATPYSTSFDHLRASDEIQYKFERTMAALGPRVSRLPVYGVGHSLGSVLHSLICSRYNPDRAGNALMAYNNRPATDSIPFLSPFIAPSARALGPLLSQLASAGPLRGAVEGAADALRGLSPSLVRQVMPLIDQLTPIFMDVSQGRQEFSPAPEETKSMIRSFYSVRRNLLLRFKDDAIDETLPLAVLLQSSSAMASSLDVSVRTLPGDHIRPMQQALVDLPPELARAANQGMAQGSSLLGRLADMASQAGLQSASAPLEDLRKGLGSLADMLGGQTGGPMADSVQALADEVAAWMGVGGVVTQGSKALPASVVVERSGGGGGGGGGGQAAV
ncbi:hypothetical protein Rsub_04280 [Raphidocelis subcapitata]|uniref:Uncharacterized protein n=1 Tax=Raphidocelis subcapitata TaxID=307507 RepID=A0A2V0P132_9CHLO|nr:hypothetical protein Rsub_04280 [Raphidocelis subcapitata]|eukprot:GBF91540.1 hypothetical protein Rsub_04280 [Raphidocelis subcapitata]